eukprot:TRINITY_DN194_c0_g1_i1.p6 TRINITY_DN194_c0_g1~~TRINITY_DN194_c0_g1_i1.p6  ORF type:complete len:263 (+),score=41.19 TRINITY_DN194_c0_g1_i1:2339-3127(+)
MSKAVANSDAHLVEVLEASKAKLNALNAEIQFAREDNEAYKRVVEECESDMSTLSSHTAELREELKRVQEKNMDLGLHASELKSGIQLAKQDLAGVIEEGSKKYKEITGLIKKAQEEQKKIQLQYRDLQKDNDKLEREREKMERLRENLERKEAEIEAAKKELEKYQEKDNGRIQSLEEHAKAVQGLSGFHQQLSFHVNLFERKHHSLLNAHLNEYAVIIQLLLLATEQYVLQLFKWIKIAQRENQYGLLLSVCISLLIASI